MEKEIKHWEFTWIPLLWFNHRMLYGCGWVIVCNPSFSIIHRETTFTQIPPSIIKEHTFPWTVHRVWNMFSLCSSLTPFWLLKTLLKTKSYPWEASSMTSSCVSSHSSSLLSLSSSSWKTSFKADNSDQVIAFWFGQSRAMCPSPWHLKHLLFS